jgi:hypothetical protein
VSKRLFHKFNEWHEKWLSDNSTHDQQKQTQQWLVSSDLSTASTTTGSTTAPECKASVAGDSKSTSGATAKSVNVKTVAPVATKTTQLVINNENSPPFRKYFKYKTALKSE